MEQLYKVVPITAVFLSMVISTYSGYSAAWRGKVLDSAIQYIHQQTIEKQDNINKEGSVSKDKFIKTLQIDSDPYFDNEWAIAYTQSDKVWSKIDQKRTVKVAVVDSGVDYNHPDLKNRVLKDTGYDFVNNDPDPIDDFWHGTHVAGIIAGLSDNPNGMTGVTGPLDIKIIPIKVLDKDGKCMSGIAAKGIRYAVDQGADIINVSIGFDVKDELIEEALQYAASKNVFVVTAAGNSNTDCSKYSPSGDAGAYTVSAVDRNLEKASFSSYGKTVAIAAPGVQIMSTVQDGKYEFGNGTSMAAPVVSGIAAMLKAEEPSLTPSQMTAILNDSAVDIQGQGRDDTSGYGIVNADRAFQLLKKLKQ